jgi:uncharacterized protein YunC (DUF1805 family)
MRKDTVQVPDGGDILIMDSISQLMESDRGRVVISGSHGGTSSSEFACRCQVKGAVFNDAGIGKDKAGIAGLDVLEEHGIMGVAVDCHSGRIGNSMDVYENGVVSTVNKRASSIGIKPGMTVKEAARRMLLA